VDVDVVVEGGVVVVVVGAAPVVVVLVLVLVLGSLDVVVLGGAVVDVGGGGGLAAVTPVAGVAGEACAGVPAPGAGTVATGWSASRAGAPATGRDSATPASARFSPTQCGEGGRRTHPDARAATSCTAGCEAAPSDPATPNPARSATPDDANTMAARRPSVVSLGPAATAALSAAIGRSETDVATDRPANTAAQSSRSSAASA
jgi:hypothetical protein